VCTLPLHKFGCTQIREADSSSNRHPSQGRNCRTGGIPVHSHHRMKNLSSFYPNICWSFSPHFCVPGERVQLHPRELSHLLLHGGHQQGPYRIYIANVVLLPEQETRHTNANIKSIFAIYNSISSSAFLSSQVLLHDLQPASQSRATMLSDSFSS